MTTTWRAARFCRAGITGHCDTALPVLDPLDHALPGLVASAEAEAREVASHDEIDALWVLRWALTNRAILPHAGVVPGPL